MPMRTANNSFSNGELDPTLYARVDVDVYTKGARKLRNMIGLWTGAARIAAGAVYVDVMVDRENSDAVISNADYVNGVDLLFDAANDVVYTIILRQSNAVSAIDIYYNDVLQATVTGAGYTNAQISNVNYVVGNDRILLLHESVAIKQLVRTSAHSGWTLSTLPWFGTATTGPYMPTFDFTTLGGTQYRLSTFTFTPNATSATTITANGAIYTAGHVGGIFRGNGGVARITAVNSGGTIATVTTITAFNATSAISGLLSSLSERVWGDSTAGTPAGSDRGWPTRGTFFINRLILGRSPVLKNLVWFSDAGIYDSFDDSEVDAISSFSASFNGRGEQAVESIIADDSIIFVTSNRVFAQSPLFETAITATNFYFSPQCQQPASEIPAVALDNQIFYPSGNKTQVTQLVFNTGDARYVGYPAGLLSNQLFETITSNGTWEPDNISAKLYLATQADGTMLMYNTLLQQKISAWSLRTTRGKYKQVIGDGREAMTIVERQINLGLTTFETPMDYAYSSNPAMTAFYNVQVDLESGSGSTVTLLENQNDYIVFGNDVPFTAIDITLDTVASSDCGLVFEYLDINESWETFTPTDNTTGLTGSGSITWAFTDVSNWGPGDVNSIEDKFWIRIQRTTAAVTTSPIFEQVEVNTGIRLFLERLDFNAYMDSQTNTSSDASGDVTGLTNLAGEQVYAISNGATSGPYFVESDGTTNIVNEYASVDIGIQYKPELVPMPLYTPTSEGNNIYSQKYVMDLFVDYVDSLYLKAGINPLISDIPNMHLNDYTLGESVPPQTGIFRINPRGDWEPRQEVVVTQSQPGPMTIIGIGYHVEVT